MPRSGDLLVIGYGNELRRDDGAGRRVAELIEAARLPRIRTRSARQLGPEFAEEVAASGGVLFVDAFSTEPGERLRVTRLIARESSARLGHAMDPDSLLWIARTLFGGAPDAWMIAIPAVDFEFGEEFSETTQAGVLDAVAEITRRASNSESRNRELLSRAFRDSKNAHDVPS